MKASTIALPAGSAPETNVDGSPSSEGSPVRPAAAGSSATTSVLRGAIAMFSTQPVTWAAALLSTMFVPRFLGDQVLGQYSIASSAASMVGTVAGLGVSVYLRRRVAAHPANATVETAGAMVLLLGTGVLAAIVMAVVLPSLGLLAAEPIILHLALANMAIAGARDILFSLMVGREMHGRFAWLNAASVVAGAVFGVGVLAAGWGIVAYIVTQIAVHVVSTAPAWYLSGARLPRAAFDPKLWWSLTRGGAPFLGWGIALAIRGQAGVLIVGALLSEQVAGWYFAAQRIAGVPAFIPVVLATPLFPVLSRIATDRRELEQTIHRVLVAVLLLTVAPAAVVIGLAPAIPDLLGWQASFSPSIPVMMILALFLPFLAINMVLGTALMAINRERQWLMVGAVAAVINPLVNVALIPVSQTWFENGAIGLAIAEVATEALMVAGAIIVMPRGLVGGRLAWLTVRIFAAGGSAAAVATALRPSSLLLAIVTSGLVYLAVVALLRVVRPADLWAFWDLVQESAGRKLGAESARTESAAYGDANAHGDVAHHARHPAAASTTSSFLARLVRSISRPER